MVGASSASVWAGLNRPVRGIVERWVRAKANSCSAGLQAAPRVGRCLGRGPVRGSGSSAMRACSPLRARGRPRGPWHVRSTNSARRSTPPTRHHPHPALQHQTPPVTAHQFLHHVSFPVPFGDAANAGRSGPVARRGRDSLAQQRPYVSLTLGAVLMGLRIVLPRARGSDSNPIPGRLPRATFPW